MTDEVEIITVGGGMGVIVTGMSFRQIPITNMMSLLRPNRSLFFFFLNAGLVDDGSVVPTLK